MTESVSFGRPFVLQRDRDISGVSGTGIIADGVLFPDGHAAIHWRGKWALTTPHPDGIDSIMDIHDHGGRGELHVIWPRESTKGREILAAAVGRAYALADRWQTAHGSANILVRAAGAELRDELDSGAAAEGIFQSGENEQVNGLSGVDYAAAAECSAQHHGFPGDHRQCIRAAQHRGDHIDEHGFHWSDTVAVYPVVEPEPQHSQVTPSCSHPDHACLRCGDCVYEHPGENGCVQPETAAQRDRFRNIGATEYRDLPEDHAEYAVEELLGTVRRTLGIDPRKGAADVRAWLLTACRELEKSEEAREHLRGQRAELAQVLREALAGFHAVKTGVKGQVLIYVASHGVHPSNFNRWRTALEGLPVNCAKPGGCPDCPHEPQPAPVVHLCPPEGRSTMPCCGRLPFEARGDRITIDAAEVTCAQIPTATCGEHPGPCFPEPGARCSAHGDEQCRLCHRNPGNCTTSGNCGMWSETGMHWDTCANRVRGPLAESEG